MRRLGQNSQMLFRQLRVRHSQKLLLDLPLPSHIAEPTDGPVVLRLFSSLIETPGRVEPSSTKKRTVPERSFMKLLVENMTSEFFQHRQNLFHRRHLVLGVVLRTDFPAAIHDHHRPIARTRANT